MGGIAAALQSITATLWVGALWAVGFVVAPTLFASLDDRALAGQLAGRLFTLTAWIGMVCAAYLLVFRFALFGRAAFRQGLPWLVLLMLGLVLAGQYGVQPILASLKEQALPQQVMASVFRDRFAAWHGVSSVLYVIQSLCGAALVILLGRGK